MKYVAFRPVHPATRLTRFTLTVLGGFALMVGVPVILMGVWG
jgi:hypothetical protein